MKQEPEEEKDDGGSTRASSARDVPVPASASLGSIKSEPTNPDEDMLSGKASSRQRRRGGDKSSTALICIRCKRTSVS